MVLGLILGAVNQGRVSAATRADDAAVAVAVDALTADDTENHVDELAGGSLDLPGLAAPITEVTGTDDGYVSVAHNGVSENVAGRGDLWGRMPGDALPRTCRSELHPQGMTICGVHGCEEQLSHGPAPRSAGCGRW